MQFSGTTYIAVLCCAMLFCKFGTFKISISHILENINHILGDNTDLFESLVHTVHGIRETLARYYMDSYTYLQYNCKI